MARGSMAAGSAWLLALEPLEEGLPRPSRGRSRSDLDEASRRERIPPELPHDFKGLQRSKSVVERLDARAVASVLFDRHSALDDWCPQDDVVLRSLAASKRRRPAGLQRLSRRAVETLQDPHLLVAVAVSAGSGAAALGVAGASCGMAVGASIGGCIGVLGTPLTLGLSVPAGCAAGGIIGTGVGAFTCSGIGLVGGGVAGGVVYEYSDAIIDSIVPLETTVGDEAGSGCSKTKALEEIMYYGKDRAIDVLRGAAGTVASASGGAAAKASELGAGVRDMALSPRLQVSAVSAAGGAVTLGTGGGIAGLAAGSALGAAWGGIPALLTFGLSIPISAAIGGATGLCAGAAIGGFSGFIGGGVVGGAAYDRREQISSCVSGCIEYVQLNAVASAHPAHCAAATGGTG